MADEQTALAIAIDLVSALQDKLTWEHGRFTGNLKSSINYKLIWEDDEVVSIEISMPDYAEYLEYGTPNPTTPEEILDWVKKKIMPDIKITKKDPQKVAQNIAESIAEHITLYGPRPFPFIRTTIDKDLPGILKSVGL